MDESQAPESAGEPKPQDLYSRHVQQFVEIAKKDPNEAIQRFGFTVWHSLPPEEAAALKERMGAQLVEPVDLYNRGTSRVRKGDYAGGESDLRATLKKDPGHALAACNLAICLEKMGRVDEARRAFENYLEVLDRARGRTDVQTALGADLVEEKARIRQHLDELGRA